MIFEILEVYEKDEKNHIRSAKGILQNTRSKATILKISPEVQKGSIVNAKKLTSATPSSWSIGIYEWVSTKSI